MAERWTEHPIIQRKEVEPSRFTISKKRVVCHFCDQDEFVAGKALLNTVGLTFLGLDWADKAAFTLLCIHCGRIEWFAQEPVKL